MKNLIFEWIAKLVIMVLLFLPINYLIKSFKDPIYFVSYSYTAKDGDFGFGNIMTNHKKVTGWNDIESFKEGITSFRKETSFKDITILNFQQL